MKKIFAYLLLSVLIFTLEAQEIPEKLCGIWEGKDRYVFFENFPQNQKPEIVIVLKEYYGWYLDRAGEPEFISEKFKRSRNAATHKNAEHIIIKDISSLLPETPEKHEEVYKDAWEICLEYSKFQQNYIPVCLIEDNLYKDFCIKYPQWDEKQKLIISKNGFWYGNATTNGITLNSQLQDENIELLIIDADKIFNVRYWLSDMEYEEGKVLFKYNENQYYVPKHIYSCGQNYSSVSGKSKKVRNTMPSEIYNESEILMNQQKTILTFEKEPYLKKLADKKTFDDLIEIIQIQNSKRKPDPPAVFPDEDLDWHWDLIDLLEKDNEIIQAVRQRQNAFGPRAKDFQK